MVVLVFLALAFEPVRKFIVLAFWSLVLLVSLAFGLTNESKPFRFKFFLPLLTSIFAIFFLKAFIFYVASVLAEKARLYNLSDVLGDISLSLDQTGNAFIYGDPDRTFSHRMGVRREQGLATKRERKLCKSLSYFDGDSDRHCLDAVGV